MKPTRSMAALAAGLVLFLTISGLAQEAGKCVPEKGCAVPNLTADQTAKIAKLKLEQEKTMVPLQAALKTKHIELRQLKLDKADLKKLEAKIDEIAKAGADIQKSCLAYKIAVMELLTDAQKKAVEEKCGSLSCGAGKDCGVGMNCGGGLSCGKGCGGDDPKAGKKDKNGKAAEECEGCASKDACKK